MIVRVLVISLLSVLLGASNLSAQTTLSCTWKEGEKFSYVIEENLPGLPFTPPTTASATSYSQSLKLDTNWHVRTVGLDGNAVITVEIERVRFVVDQKGIPLPYEHLNVDTQNPVDTQNKVERITFNAVRGFVGSQIEITINGKREVTKFEFAEPLAAHFERNQIMRELAYVYGPAFRKEGMRRRITGWLIASPPTSVSKGGTWRREDASYPDDSILYIDSCTLGGPVLWDRQTLTKIDVKSQVKLLDNDLRKQESKSKETNCDGVVYIDERTGRIIDATLCQPFSSEVNLTITAKLLTKPEQ